MGIRINDVLDFKTSAKIWRMQNVISRTKFFIFFKAFVTILTTTWQVNTCLCPEHESSNLNSHWISRICHHNYNLINPWNESLVDDDGLWCLRHLLNCKLFESLTIIFSEYLVCYSFVENSNSPLSLKRATAALTSVLLFREWTWYLFSDNCNLEQILWKFYFFHYLLLRSLWRLNAK